MKGIGLCAVLASAGWLAARVSYASQDGAASDQPPPVTGFGVGYHQCSEWLANDANIRDGENWIFGFWSAVNVLNNENHTVGHGAEPNDIINEIHSICEREPSARLGDVTSRVYDMYWARGK